MERRPKSDLLRGDPRLALVAILAAAAALRLPGIRYGLPFGNLLNPDEQSIVPRAWRMVHGGGLDPEWFDYPTLVLYLLAPFQGWQGSPSYLSARLVVAALGVAAVAASWWLGRRAYGAAAGVVAAGVVAVQTTHVAYSHMAVTDVPLTLGVAASLALMISGRLEWAGLVAGLAAGAKYPGVFLAFPLLVSAWGQWRRLALSAALGVAAFVGTSPFVAVHSELARDEALRVQRLAREGWLGFEHDSFALFAFSGRVWWTFGPVALVAVAGLAVALRERRRADLALSVFVLVYFANLLTLGAHFDRYLLPLVPALGALAGRIRPLVPLAILFLALPLAWSIRDDVRLTRTDTRVAAADWLERNLPQGARVAADPSTPAVRGIVLPLLLPGPKRGFDSNRAVDRLREQGISHVLVTGAVADRVLAARDRYPREARFYADLRTRARRLYYVSSGKGLAGPWVALYRL